MQTVQTTHTNHHAMPPVQVDIEPDHLKHSEKADLSLEIASILQELSDEADSLCKRAQELDGEVLELEKDGDYASSQEAGLLKTRSSEEIQLANRLHYIAAEIKADPTKKGLRQQAKALSSQAHNVIIEAQHETETAHSVHTTAVEHKVAVQHATHDAKKPEEHKPLTHDRTVLPTKKKATTTVPPKKAASKNTAPSNPQASPPQAKPVWGFNHVSGPLTAYGQPVCYAVPDMHWQNDSWQSFGTMALTVPMQYEDVPAPAEQTTKPAPRKKVAKPINGQVVAAVKTVTIPSSVGSLVAHPSPDPLAPSFQVTSWNLVPPTPDYS